MDTVHTVQLGGNNTSITKNVYQSGSQLGGIDLDSIPKELREKGLFIVNVVNNYYGGTAGQSGGASMRDARSSRTESVSDLSKEEGRKEGARSNRLKRKRRDQCDENVKRRSSVRKCKQKSSDKEGSQLVK